MVSEEEGCGVAVTRDQHKLVPGRRPGAACSRSGAHALSSDVGARKLLDDDG